MTPKMEIAILIGSLRKESVNRKLALELIRLAPENMKLHIVEIGDLALYNQDLEENPPQEWIAFRKAVKEADGVFFVSPEYNRSIPGVLKNAIDIGSRPPLNNVWKKKPAAVATASRSGISGALANHAIRQAVVFSEVRMMPKEIYIDNMDKLFEDDEKTVVKETEKFLADLLVEFEEWVKLFPENKS